VNVTVLSAYHADSHARWVDGLVRELPDIRFDVRTLPARWFAWRSGSAALTWAFEHPDALQRCDLILATSITDVASLRGLVPRLHSVPVVLYFHENQFAYPLRPNQTQDARMLMQSIIGALSADRLIFNSEFNRQSFLEGAQAFLAGMPDHQPVAHLRLAEKSQVLPVPLEIDCFGSSTHRTPRLVWNHRWEWDKAPDRFFAALRLLKAQGVQPRVAIAGQRFRTIPTAIRTGLSEFANQIDTSAYLDRHAYRELLNTSSHVVSTALHEFQGLSVLEACAAGCEPIVPDRLSYRELFAPSYRYGSTPLDPELEATQLAAHIKAALEREPQAPDVTHLSWEHLRVSYRDLLNGSLGR
jgi:glycosyltransferase involved in cell wall biosynthesis